MEITMSEKNFFPYTALTFPGFKRKALTLSYDDGVIEDERLVEIMRRHGVKGTFNINSKNLDGAGGRCLPTEILKKVYGDDMEIAVHGYDHLPLGMVPMPLAMRDVVLDRENLEVTFDRLVRGMAYAYGTYSDEAIEMLRGAGIVYARTTESSYSFNLPEEWLTLHPTCHHRDERLGELTEEFLDNTPSTSPMLWKNPNKLFYVWGHSYEFNDRNNWELIENFCEKVGGKDYVWYATNIEIYDYVRAFESLVYSADGNTVFNPTTIDVYTCLKDKDTLIPAGATVVLN
jgi:peptidoglycan/xylan/chitin deacetylase (PgdA/CDA1 family)